MTKKLKKRFLLLTVLFCMLIVSCACFSGATVYAAEESVQEKGKSILNDVVGLDLAKYSTTTEELQQTEQGLYRGVIQRKSVDYNLAYGESKIRVLCNFADEKLQMLHVLDNYGSPTLAKSSIGSDSLEMAKDFLSSYQQYTSDSLFGELRGTLNDVEAEKNATVTSGTATLEVTHKNEYKRTTYKWTYTFNGAKAPKKFVSLGFENGFLSFFVDNWQFYNVGSTIVNLSEKEAIDIALKTAADHSWSLPLDDDDAFETRNFNSSNVRWTTLGFEDSLNASNVRNEDILTLYPVWRVGIALNRWYGNLYGIEVEIWADTKEVRYTQEAWSTMLPPTEDAAGQISADTDPLTILSGFAEKLLNFDMLLALSVFATFTIGIPAVFVNKKKLKSYPLLRLRSLKTCGILLLGILSFAFFVPIATVNATQTKGAVIWGSESDGAGEYPNSWRKHYSEIDFQRAASSLITEMFDLYTDYDYALNMQGDGSQKEIIHMALYYLETHCDSYIVVDFDHGVGRTDYSEAPDHEFHYMFEDQIGTHVGSPYDHEEVAANGVYDMDIHNWISEGKVSFALINTCLSGRVEDWYYENPEDPEDNQWVGQGLIDGQRAQGMPFAWTHRTVHDKTEPWFDVEEHMSNDGYDKPDIGSQCYIGFSYGSASLMQPLPFENPQAPYGGWLELFFYYALWGDISIKWALDHASVDCFGLWFGECPLQDFTCYWWDYFNPLYGGQQNHCKMNVYGNARIRLNHPFEDILSISAGAGGTTNPSPDDYYNPGTSVPVSAISDYHYAFDYWLLDGEFYSDEEDITVPMDGNHELQAVFKYQYGLWVSAGAGGTTTNPSPGTYWYNLGEFKAVTAVPYENYVFSHWVVNCQYPYYGETIYFYMTEDTAIHAFFTYVPPPPPPQTYNVYLYAMDENWNPQVAVVYIEGCDPPYHYTLGQAIELEEGQHTLTVEYPTANFKYWLGPGPYGWWPISDQLTLNINLQSDMSYCVYYEIP